MKLHPEDLQTVSDLAASLDANEPAVVVSLGGGRVLAMGGPGLPTSMLNELAAVVVRYINADSGRATWQ
jgi:hypothetical protein